MKRLLAITLYFYWQNILGIHESSEKALRIMQLTTIMAVIVITWCAVTLVVNGPRNSVPVRPDLNLKTEVVEKDGLRVEQPRLNPVTGHQEDPLGFLRYLSPSVAETLSNLGHGTSWLSLFGLIGIGIAFGHSVLAMSGEETLAQVYREIESPKLPNLQKAAFVVFIYSLVLTGGISFLAVMIIPNDVRMSVYSDNLISGLIMNVIGPNWAKLFLNAFVVFIGFLILAGAVNTAIIGSNGVLNRVAEDGVMPDWFLKPHLKYGTTYRVLTLIVGLQILIIILSRGDVLVLGEAYAFGVLWSFVFQALAMTVLRFKDRRPREYKVPLNFHIGKVEIPFGLLCILLVLLSTAALNFLTKEVATISGVIFTAFFFAIFFISERIYERRHGAHHEHLEQFNEEHAEEVSAESLGLRNPHRKLVSIRSPQNLFMLEKALAETDPDTTDVVVMTAKFIPTGEQVPGAPDLDRYDQQLLTAVVERAERAGKEVKPLIIPTNNPLYAIIRTAAELKVQELVMGASNKYTADEQLEQIAFYWIEVNGGQTAPLTVRILGRDRDVLLDLGGGSRIPKISERQARSVAELRAAGVGVDRVLLLHDGSRESSDLFQAVLTMLDPQVFLALVPSVDLGAEGKGAGLLSEDVSKAAKLDRVIKVETLKAPDLTSELVRLVREGRYDLMIVSVTGDKQAGAKSDLDPSSILRQAPCRVFLAAPAAIPQEPEQ